MPVSEIAANDGQTAAQVEIPDINAYIAELAQKRIALLRAADNICAEVSMDISELNLNLYRFGLSVEQQMLLDTLGWDKRQIQKNVGRMAQVLEYQKLAGTSAERVAAQQAAAQAAAKVNDEAPRIEAEIETLIGPLPHDLKTGGKLGGRLGELHRHKAETQELVNKQNAALARLRELLPDDVKSNYEIRLLELQNEWHQEIQEVQDAIEPRRFELETELKRVVNEAHHARDDADGPRFAMQNPDERNRRRLEGQQLTARATALRQQLDHLMNESTEGLTLARLKAARDSAVAELERTHLDMYAR